MINSIFYGRVRKIHFIGIGGIGMSGIAEVLLSLGLEVHGSDLNENDTTKRLKRLGAKITLGHHESNVDDADVIVTSSAVKADNPEVIKAHQNNIPVIPRAEMLGELMRLQHGIAISGSHGKTTTTSLVATLLQHAGFDPTVVIGGKVNQLGSNAKLGQGKFLVAEADESDGSFLLLSPSIAVVTNIDPEHLDYWKGGLDELKKEFTNFVNALPFFGLCAVCTDSENVRAILPQVKRRFVSYGIDHPADYMAHDVEHNGLHTSFRVTLHGQTLGTITTQLVGRHNVLNALATIAVGDELGIPFATMAVALSEFAGVQRRFTLVGEVHGITIIDDYGHHPTEIDAVLKAAKVTFPGRRIVVLFQPHRYSRTFHLLNDFKGAFTSADLALLTDIYSAGESPLEGISSQRLVELCHKKGFTNTQYAGDLQHATEHTAQIAQTGDVIITLGAGSITHSAPKLLELLTQMHGKTP